MNIYQARAMRIPFKKNYMPGECHTKVLQARRIPGESHINTYHYAPGEAHTKLCKPGEYQANDCQAKPIRNLYKPGGYQANDCQAKPI